MWSYEKLMVVPDWEKRSAACKQELEAYFASSPDANICMITVTDELQMTMDAPSNFLIRRVFEHHDEPGQVARRMQRLRAAGDRAEHLSARQSELCVVVAAQDGGEASVQAVTRIDTFIQNAARSHGAEMERDVQLTPSNESGEEDWLEAPGGVYSLVFR